MEALSSGAQRLLLGESDVVAALGVESMSNIPLLFNQTMTAFFTQLMKAKTFVQKCRVLASFRLSHLKPIVALELGLTD